MSIQTQKLTAGFTDQVIQSQQVFRSILDSLSNPSRCVSIGHHVPECPDALPSAVAAALLTLADYETPVYLAPRFHTKVVLAWLAFHAGCPIVGLPDQATFAVLDGAEPSPTLDQFNLGDERYPDRSTTVFVVCETLSGGSPVSLYGPGIEHVALISPIGLHEDFWHGLAANHSRFPMSVDVMLVAGSELSALPRTTLAKRGETV
jgi:alpha-D-ribose 1-methylphosphonate 5-triphosphate synthase subunit PhnH